MVASIDTSTLSQNEESQNWPDDYLKQMDTEGCASFLDTSSQESSDSFSADSGLNDLNHWTVMH